VGKKATATIFTRVTNPARGWPPAWSVLIELVTGPAADAGHRLVTQPLEQNPLCGTALLPTIANRGDRRHGPPTGDDSDMFTLRDFPKNAGKMPIRGSRRNGFHSHPQPGSGEHYKVIAPQTAPRQAGKRKKVAATVFVYATQGPRLPIGMTATPSGRTYANPFPVITPSNHVLLQQFQTCFCNGIGKGGSRRFPFSGMIA
jgi:hypothetical protein